MHDGNSQMKISYPTLCAREDKHPKLATTPSHRDQPNPTAVGLAWLAAAAELQEDNDRRASAMSVVVLDGSTVRSFVADEAAFARFADLDANGDGVLSRAELRRALESFRLLDGGGAGAAPRRSRSPRSTTPSSSSSTPSTAPSSATRCAASCSPSPMGSARSLSRSP
jgi:hypothetical protein